MSNLVTSINMGVKNVTRDVNCCSQIVKVYLIKGNFQGYVFANVKWWLEVLY